MASFIGNLSPAILQSRLADSSLLSVKSRGAIILKRRLSIVVRAASNAVAETKLTDSILACPICYQRLESDRDSPLSLESVSGTSLQCGTCRKTYFGNDTHFELTASSGAKTYGDPMPLATELFRTPLVSFLYERGWRQSFLGGFPGPEKEFEMSKKFLEPAFGGRIVDASCGSGMFSRLFVKSGLFSSVVALDYSENMLKECHDFIKQEPDFPKEKISLVRADIARLPFVSGSVDAVHAGAALHCWPSPLAAVAEISRVLRPGGVFVATTYILDGPFNFVPLTRNFIVQNIRRLSGSTSFQSEQEMQDLCEACGLVGFTCIRNRAFVMISATKHS